MMWDDPEITDEDVPRVYSAVMSKPLPGGHTKIVFISTRKELSGRATEIEQKYGQFKERPKFDTVAPRVTFQYL